MQLSCCNTVITSPLNTIPIKRKETDIFFHSFFWAHLYSWVLKKKLKIPILSTWCNLDCTLTSCYERAVGTELPRLVVNYVLQAEKIETGEIILNYMTAGGKKV